MHLIHVEADWGSWWSDAPILLLNWNTVLLSGKRGDKWSWDYVQPAVHNSRIYIPGGLLKLKLNRSLVVDYCVKGHQ